MAPAGLQPAGLDKATDRGVVQINPVITRCYPEGAQTRKVAARGTARPGYSFTGPAIMNRHRVLPGVVMRQRDNGIRIAPQKIAGG